MKSSVPSVSVDSSRSIVLTLRPVADLDDRVGDWLVGHNVGAVFASGVLASPVRDGGQSEQVLAIEGLDKDMVASLVADLGIDLVVDPFHSRR